SQPSRGLDISDDDVQKLLEAAENLFNPGIVIEEWAELDIDEEDLLRLDMLRLEGRTIIPASEPPRSSLVPETRSKPLAVSSDHSPKGIARAACNPRVRCVAWIGGAANRRRAHVYRSR
ncbi:hypothetical protein HC776_02515, partial [bacterium]|nr:hypothetical protein [bacterium]